jgi:hypothetical protein
MPNKETITYGITALCAFVLGCLLMRQCSGECKPITTTIETVTIKHDTIKPPTVYVPMKVYIKQPIAKIEEFVFDTAVYHYTRVYSDSLVNDEIVIVYRDSVDGVLLGKDLSYRRLSPLQINTTKTIVDSVLVKVKVPTWGVYGTLGLDSKLGVLVGVDFISKTKWGAGYSYNMQQGTHAIGFKWRLF